MTRSTCLAFCFIAFASAPVVQADFTVNDVIASDPNSDLPAPEFDRITKRVIWEDRSGNVWVGPVDLATGKLNPKTGKGTLVDTGASPVNTILNTPRYTWGGGQGAIVYNHTIGGIRTLAKAVEVSPNTWVPSLLEDGDNRWKPNGSPEETTDPARIVYNHQRDDGVTVTSWRTLDDPLSEQSVVGVQGGRFFGSERSVVYMQDTAGIIQIYNIPFDTMIPEQVSFGTQSNYNAFIWFAPEFQQYVIVAMTDWEQLAFYRKINGVWTMFNQFAVPSSKPLLSSPEGFAANGKSFVAVVACDQLGAGGFVGQPVGPSEVWVVGIDPAHPFSRRIDDPLHTAQRAEPEPFLLDTGPVVFYSEVKNPNLQWLKRASTGLAADTGYEVAHFGGNWSGALRDNKNCSCTPYGVANLYASAYDVPMSNTQFVHATLGPENHLYYGAIDTTGGGSTRQLVVLDTTTGAEAYRLSEQTGLETLSATNALVDTNGAYYIPGNDALRKYNSGGVLQWTVPTHGLARSAQFAPDGNIVFFTWNGWSYIVSQDGVLLNEMLMTGSRTFPPNPVCLAPGNLCGIL